MRIETPSLMRLLHLLLLMATPSLAFPSFIGDHAPIFLSP
jgi:hypothetical protein